MNVRSAFHIGTLLRDTYHIALEMMIENIQVQVPIQRYLSGCRKERQVTQR